MKGVFQMRRVRAYRVLSAVIALSMLLGAVPVHADVPAKTPPSASRSAMPMPGTQEQELPNITFPAPYNTFEFVVTCMACHGGTIDQNVGHGTNWAGTNMASSARDPIFRANELIVNATVRDGLGAGDGAGNLCFRCHSPNGWYSGRFNPKLNGDAQGADLMQSPLMSTDAEGIMCELCHRSIGNVKMNHVPGQPFPSDDKAFNLMANVYDWEHSGSPYPEGPNPGDPLGDATLQLNDGMTYAGKYPGSVEVTFSDVPMDGTPYTGQTYAVYPNSWPAYIKNPVPNPFPQFNSLGQEVAYGPDGSVATHFEEPADVPRDGSGNKDFMAQAISLEHPTTDANQFIRSSEFCGSCHDLTVPVEGSGMPEQRTYTEWAYSDYGRDLSGDGVVGQTDDSLAFEGGDKRCQDCHMPTKKHEYADDVNYGLNVDPALAGYFPYGKDRNPQGGTAFHKFAGANANLPQMMKFLYPEVDLEVIGAETGNDVRIFPGMMSDRSSMWDRATRNTELSLRESVSVDIVSAPTEVEPGIYETQIEVSNNTGHRVPSGYPDGRRLWVHLNVVDAEGNSVFESGEYDDATATLSDERSQDALVESAGEVMVYEKVTATDHDADGEFEESPHLLNNKVIFDNRIPPKGFDKVEYEKAGAKFVAYTDDPAKTGVTPAVDMDRFADNTDVVTYRFTADPGLNLDAVAEMKYQSHSRPFMEMLKDDQPANTPRPQGPPSIYAPNYPLEPNYLSDVIGLENYADLDGQPLEDNWGGIAYAAWLETGKGAPQVFDMADSGVTDPPSQPVLTVSTPPGDEVLGQTIGDPFSLDLSWTPATGADGYEIWIRYGLSEATAAWDKLAMVDASTTSFRSDSLNVGKTYGYKVVAFNSAGETASDPVDGMTPTDLPVAPENLKVLGVTASSVSLSWFDMSDNEDGFVIQRQEVGMAGPTGPFVTIAVPTSEECLTESGAAGAATWTDTTAAPGTTYNYQVAAYNVAGMSTFTLPVMARTIGVPSAPTDFSATAVSPTRVDLTWTASVGTVSGYRIYRATSAAGLDSAPVLTTLGGTATSFSDLTAAEATTYFYRVVAYNGAGDSLPAETSVTTPVQPPAAPSGLSGNALWAPAPIDAPRVTLNWTDNATNEDGFVIERALQGGTFAPIFTSGANATMYTDAAVEPKVTYSYRVRSFRTVGGVDTYSAYSNTIDVVTPGEPPVEPLNFRVTGVSQNKVTLGWVDASNNETGFQIARSTNGTTWTLLGWSVPANSTRYTDTAPLRKTTYYYRMRSFNADGFSAWTPTVVTKTK